MMKLVRQSGQIKVGRVNYWPMLVPALCIALWWPILAFLFNVRVATVFAVVATCLLVMVIALALLADALGIEDGLIHFDEDELFPIIPPADGHEASREAA